MQKDIYKTYFTKLLNDIDAIIRKNNNIDYETKNDLLEKLQLLHYDYSLLYNYCKDKDA